MISCQESFWVLNLGAKILKTGQHTRSNVRYFIGRHGFEGRECLQQSRLEGLGESVQLGSS